MKQTMRPSDIAIGNRHRRDFGDIDALAASIADLGLLQPVVVAKDGLLIAGERRLAAVEKLGWQEVPVYVVTNLDDAIRQVRAELAENTCRKDFTPEEAVMASRTLEQLEAEEARRRMQGGIPCGNLPQGNAKTRDRVASAIGMSGRTYEKAKKVVEAAQKCPETHADLLGQMNETGKVDAAYKELRRREATAGVLATAEQTCTADDLCKLVAAGKKFSTLYADPPWQYGNQATRASTDNHYPTMTVEEIAALPAAQLAADNAHLHLWTTNAFIFEARQILEAWGFTYKSMLVWVKPQMGIGNYWRVSHELLLLGVRGDCPFLDRSQKSWFEAERTAHSAKPAEARQRIERVSPPPRLELFGRQTADGWTVWGNQIRRSMFDSDVEAL